MEWHLPRDKPADYQSRQQDNVIFCDDNHYYLGNLDPGSKWYDYESKQAFDAINCWAFLPGEPASLQNIEVNQEWNSGNGPVPPNFKYFLLFDNGTITCKDIDGSYFDSQNKTFPDITHWLALPNLPLRLIPNNRILNLGKELLQKINARPELTNLKLDVFNKRCMLQAIDETYNTTTNGVRRHYLLQGDQLFMEIISRWAFRVNNWLNKAEGKNHIELTFGEIKPPSDETDRQSIRATLDLIIKTFSKNSLY
jgi:hypothetical protein